MPARPVPFWLLLLAAATATAQTAPDFILLNGRVLTVDRADSIAQAVAVRGGKIVAVGTNEAVRAQAGKDTHIIDLGGRAVTPGLIDSHCHFTETAALYEVDLGDPAVARIADVLKKVGDKAASVKPGEWVRGSGWDEGKLAERRRTKRV